MIFKTYLNLSHPSYLLHGFDTGTGTSRRCPVPRRSPHRWADTGLCCPIWACRPPPPSPSSPGRHERGCVHPDLGLESWIKTSPFWHLVVFRNRKVWLLRCLLCVVFLSVHRSSHAVSSRSEFYPSYTTSEEGMRYLLWPMVQVISSSLQSVLYYVMSAILRRCDHLKIVNTLHMMSSFFLPSFTHPLWQV